MIIYIIKNFLFRNPILRISNCDQKSGVIETHNGTKATYNLTNKEQDERFKEI